MYAIRSYYVFTYKCDNFYNKEAERSINPFDRKLDIDWKVDQKLAIVSEKDYEAPLFDDAQMNFSF